MGNYTDYEMNQMTAVENAKDDREELLRKRSAAQTQPPYSIIINHRLLEASMTQSGVQVWCACEERFPLEMHAYHVRDMILNEMIGEV